MRFGAWTVPGPENLPSVLVRAEGDGPARALRIAVFGEVDCAGAGMVQRTVVDVLRHERPERIVIDLGGVPFLDTGGIKALQLCRVDAGQLDCEIRLANLQPPVYRVLQIAGMLEYFGAAVAPQRAGSPHLGTGPSMGMVNCGLTG